MGHVNSNIAREISRLHGWRDKIWSRRYQAIVISGEEEAQVARLKYLLAHGCKEASSRALRAGRELTSPEPWSKARRRSRASGSTAPRSTTPATGEKPSTASSMRPSSLVHKS
jgi:hypothetical protein